MGSLTGAWNCFLSLKIQSMEATCLPGRAGVGLGSRAGKGEAFWILKPPRCAPLAPTSHRSPSWLPPS